MKTNYIALSIPVFFILIGVELLVGWLKGRSYYRMNDAISNLSQGIGQQVIGIIFKIFLASGYLHLYNNYRISTLPNTLLYWVILIFGVDFLYYWFHRLSHEINSLWAAHIVHHQSEDYNLSVALRQSWFQNFFSFAFYLPLALLGFDPIMFVTVSSFNTLYQFWIHTETIGKLGPLEWIFNTPSHHRVHHGSNPKYIDKNHAGSFIIWDRMFGTFQEEDEKVYYGITTPLNSWNPIWANFHYWFELWNIAKRSSGIWNKLLVFIKHPGWHPTELGGIQHPKDIDIQNYSKYNIRNNKAINRYAFVQFVLILLVASVLLFIENKLQKWQIVAFAIVIIMGLTTVGGYLERKKWALGIDILRLIITSYILSTIQFTYLKATIFLFIASLFWTIFLFYKNVNKQEAPKV